MRILYGITKSNWGGAQRYVYDMALGAREAGHEVAVLCGGNGILLEKLVKAGIRVVSLPRMGRDIKPADEIRNFFEIFKILRAERPDVFHINSSKMGGTGALAGRLARVRKIIFTAHGWAFNEPRHWSEKMLIEELAWLTVLLSHKTICVSEAVKRTMRGKPLIQDKLVVVRNGIESFNLEPKKRCSKALIVGTVSELHKVKGVDIALRGFARAFKYADARFEIVGEGEERERLESLARELGVEKQVKFLGFKENARELLSRFDIFVLASRSEALGYVLLEAGLAKLPVVASRVGGIPEIVEDGKTGLLFACDRFQELAEALKRLSENESLRQKLGENLHKHVLLSFGKQSMVEDTLRSYR